MSALAQLKPWDLPASLGATGDLTAIETARGAIATYFWRWFFSHQRDVILSRRILGLFSIKLTVGDCRPVFLVLFGDSSGNGAS